MTGYWQLIEAATNLRRLNPNKVVHGWHNIGDEHKLVAHGAALLGRHTVWPMEHHRHVHTALVGVLLVPAVRRVAYLGPTPRVVGVAVWATNGVDALHCFVGHLDDAVEELHLVHDAERAALL